MNEKKLSASNVLRNVNFSELSTLSEVSTVAHSFTPNPDSCRIEAGSSNRTARESKSSSQKVEDGDDDSNGEQRERFTSKWAFIMTCVGFAVGLGNIWRFPSLAYENGGGAFLFPYITMSFLFGMPMLYFEFIGGQYMQCGPSTIFHKYMPALQGVGWSMAGLALQLIIYYLVICAWVFIYLKDIVLGQSHTWSRCDNEWNTEWCNSDFNNDECKTLNESTPFYYKAVDKCVSQKFGGNPFPENRSAYVPSEEYFENYVLQRSSGLGDFEAINWKVLGFMAFLWALCALILWKGVKFLGKLSYFTTLAPYIIVAILFFRAITLDGARRGLDYYLLKPNFEYVFNIDTWKEALKQMCYSLSIGFGGLQTMASYNKKSHNCFRDAAIVVFADGFMSIFGGTAVFCVLGYLSVKTGVPMEQVVQSGTSLAFVAYPEAMARMPVTWLWSSLFFLMLALLGLSTTVVHVQTCSTCITDYWPHLKEKKTLVNCAVCFVCFIAGLVINTNAGIYWFTIFDTCTGGFSMCLVILLEVIIVAYGYGLKNYGKDIQTIFGPPTKTCSSAIGPSGFYFKLNWWIISPALAVIILITTAMRDDLSYGKGSRMYNFPTWGNVSGWLLTFLVLIFIPIFFVINLRKAKREEGTYMAAFRIHPSHPSYARIMGLESESDGGEDEEEVEEHQKNEKTKSQKKSVKSQKSSISTKESP